MSGDVTDRDIDRGTLRTFVAIDLPTPILRALSTTQEQLKTHLRAQKLDAALRWSPVKNLHLTLRFLGDTTARQREQVTTRLQELAAQATPFTLSVDVTARGLGGFPNLRQPRVLWTGIVGELNELRGLQVQVEQVALAVGFAPEERGFSPHLTLARAAREGDRRTLQQVGQAIGDYARLPATPQTLSFEVDRLVYYHSELGAGGSRYIALAELLFAAA
jgi:RNA 2',3'-cyclic 3'-phosphodiesterase